VPYSQRSAMIYGLSSGYYYAFQVSAVNQAIDVAIQNAGGASAGVLRALDVVSSDLIENFTTSYFYIAALPDAPAMPAVLESTRTASGMTLAWEAPTDSGGIPLTGYMVYRVTPAPQVLLYNGDGQPHVYAFEVTGLTGGIMYSFAVTALNGAGESAQSPAVQVYAGTPPPRMDTLTRDPDVTRTSNAVTLLWEEVDASGGLIAPTQHYEIRWDDGDYTDMSNTMTNLMVPTRSATISSLSQAKFYRFQIRAHNVNGPSEWSPVYRTQVCALPDAVSFPDPPFTDHTDTSVTLTWEPPSFTGCSYGAMILGYQVEMRQGANPWALVHSGDPSVLTLTQRGLSPGMSYTFRVRICQWDNCDQVSEAPAIRAGQRPVFVNQAISFVYADEALLKLEWTVPEGLPILEYELRVGEDNDAGPMIHGWFIGTGTAPTLNTWTSEIDDRPLDIRQITFSVESGATLPAFTWVPNRYYRFKIRARNENGWGPFSGIQTFARALPPTEPLNLQYLSSTEQTLAVKWDEPAAVGIRIVRYEIEWQDLTSNSEIHKLVTSPAFKVASPSIPLTTGSSYSFRVSACTINECSSYTTKLVLVAGAKPEAPTPPSIKASTRDDITMTWSYVGKYNGGVALTHYNVKYWDGSAYVQAGSTPDASTHVFTFPGCSSEQQTWYFRISAVSSVGEGPLSQPVGMFCAPAPGRPNSPTLESTASTLTVKLWFQNSPPTDAQLENAPAAGWRVLLDDVDDGEDTFTETAVYDTTATEFTFTSGIITGHKYRAMLKLCSIVGCSEQSDISAYKVAASPPELPAPVYAQASTDDLLTIAWGFSGSNGGSPILKWKIVLSFDGDHWPSSEEVNDVADAFLSPGLACDPVNTPTQKWCMFETDVNQMFFDIPCNDYGRSKEVIWTQVAGYSVAGVGTFSHTVAPRCSDVPFAPSRPNAPTRVDSSMHHITITWPLPSQTDLHDALHAGYKIWMDDGADGPFTAVTLTDNLQTRYTKTGTYAGAQYRFKIQYLSEVGESAESDVLAAVAAAPPDAPVVLITSTSNTEIEYAAELRGSTGGAPITSWQLYVSEDGFQDDIPTSPTVEDIPANFQTRTYTCPSPKATYYWFRIHGVNAAGLGAGGTVKTKCSSVPDQPPSPTRVTSTANSVTIDIKPANLHDAYLTGFKVYTDDGADGPWSIDSVLDTTQRTFTKYGLSPGLPYKFKYQVVSEVGTSAISDTVTHYAAATPDPPTIYVTGTDPDGIYLAWTPGFDGGAPITKWRVYGSKTGLGWPDDEWTIDSSAMYVNDDPTPYARYIDCRPHPRWGDIDVRARAFDGYLYFKVAGVNAAGVGQASNSFRFRCAAQPTQPDRPQKVSGTASSITISYAPRAEDDNNGAIFTGYKILYDDGFNGNWQEVTITQTSQTQYTIGGLTAGLQYQIKVKVLSEVGESEPSDPMRGFTTTYPTIGADADPPTPPHYVSSDNCPDSFNRDIDCELTVGWDFPGSNGGAAVESWYLYYAGSFADLLDISVNTPQAMVLASVSPPTATFFCRNVGGGQIQKNVFFRVAAVTSVGVGQYSGVSTVFCANRPDAPLVYDHDGTEGSITVTFQEQNLYKAKVLGYKIYMNDGLGGRLTYRGMVEDTSQRYFTATGLITDRPYRIQVTVVSEAGESLPGAPEFGAVRSCGFPSKPSAPKRGAATANDVELIWQAPADNGCPMTKYEIYRSENHGVTWVIMGQSMMYTVLRNTFAGLVPKTVYSWKLRACNARGCTDSEVVYLKAAGIPDQITTLKAEYEATTAGPNSIALSWVAPDMQEGIPVGYKVYRNSGDGGPVSDYPDPTCGMDSRPAPQRCTVTGLQRGKKYRFQIVGVNEIGEGSRSVEQEFKAAAVPAKITTLRNPTGGYAPSLRYEWDAPNDRGAYIYNYDGQVQKLTDAGAPLATPITLNWNTESRGNLDKTDTFVELNDWDLIRPGEQYRFRVRGYNEQGPAMDSDWGWSDWSTTTPTQDGDSPVGWTLNQPTAPTNFGRAAQGLPTGDPVADAITVGWQGYTVDPAPELGGDEVANAYYEVYAGLSPTTMSSQGTVPSTMLDANYPDVGQSHYFTLSGLQVGTRVYFQVYTWNRAWRSLEAVTPHLELIAAQKPSTPTFVKITSTTANTVDLEWNYPADDGGAPLIEYDISYGVNKGDAAFTIQIGPGLTDTTWAMGYDDGTTESFHIRARTNAGYSDWETVSCCPYSAAR